MDNPYTPPTTESPLEENQTPGAGSIPGIDRTTYALWLFFAWLSLSMSFPTSPYSMLFLPIGILIGLVASASRIANIGWSPWLGLSMLLPLINLLVIAVGLVCPPGFATQGKFDTGSIVTALALAIWIIAVAMALT